MPRRAAIAVNCKLPESEPVCSSRPLNHSTPFEPRLLTSRESFLLHIPDPGAVMTPSQAHEMIKRSLALPVIGFVNGIFISHLPLPTPATPRSTRRMCFGSLSPRIAHELFPSRQSSGASPFTAPLSFFFRNMRSVSKVMSIAWRSIPPCSLRHQQQGGTRRQPRSKLNRSRRIGPSKTLAPLPVQVVPTQDLGTNLSCLHQPLSSSIRLSHPFRPRNVSHRHVPGSFRVEDRHNDGCCDRYDYVYGS